MDKQIGARGGWAKDAGNPFLKWDAHGTCFDPAILVDEPPRPRYRLYFSWRAQNAIALIESGDARQWSEPRIVLGSAPRRDFSEFEINRQIVLKQGGLYHMYYSGQAPDHRSDGHARIFHAISRDGYEWKRDAAACALAGTADWEKFGVMCPHVAWNAEREIFQMWYSGMRDGGSMYEPDAIGYAESADGANWRKHPANPIFKAADISTGGGAGGGIIKVTACQVLPFDGWHIMFYIGFLDHDKAAICLARSKDGISNWEQRPQNPIIAPDPGAWDSDSCYKPSACFDGARWLLWYNGRRGEPEQLGLAIKEGRDLWN
jgi:Predicted glycosylase